MTTDINKDLSSFSLLDLFKSEVETQTQVLKKGLLIFGKDPNLKTLETLMRAAHSIKGAARIVGVEPAVKVSHLLEGCFVAMQEKKIQFNAMHIDVFSKSVDTLLTISQLGAKDLDQWTQKNKNELENVFNQLQSVLQGKLITQKLEKAEVDKSNASNKTKIKESENDLSAETESKKNIEVSDDFIRVSSENFNKLMNLASECMVSTKWFSPFEKRLMDAKKNQEQLIHILNDIYNAEKELNLTKDAKTHFLDAHQQSYKCFYEINDCISELEEYSRLTSNITKKMYHSVLASQMRPFSDISKIFPRMVRDISKTIGKKINLKIKGGKTFIDRNILKKLEAPLFHIVRNSIDHGIEMPKERLDNQKQQNGSVIIEAYHKYGMLFVSVYDDGEGINIERLRNKVVKNKLATEEIANKLTDKELYEFLFLPGFSTTTKLTQLSGRGIGLDVVQNMIKEVGGLVRVESQYGKHTKFFLQLPLSLSVLRVLLTEIANEIYAFPLLQVNKVLKLSAQDIKTMKDNKCFLFEKEYINLVTVHQVLGLSEPAKSDDEVTVVVVESKKKCYGFIVDKFIEECELVVKPIDERLKKVKDISCSAVLNDGSPILLFDVDNLINSVNNFLSEVPLKKIVEHDNKLNEKRNKKILVVEDSITVREAERILLENSGYEVDIAVDGVDGWDALRSNVFDLVISDVDMPRMDGIELVRKIKNNPNLSSIPVIMISYKDRKQDRVKGISAGADYYLTKSSFQDHKLLDVVAELIG